MHRFYLWACGGLDAPWLATVHAVHAAWHPVGHLIGGC